MKVTVMEQRGAQNQLIIQCDDASDPEIRELLHYVENFRRKIPSNQGDALLMTDPSQVLYAEFVSRTVFLYTTEDVRPTNLSLAQLEHDFNAFLRCSKSMVVNLDFIEWLKSDVSGRILATLTNGERILISRHYASSLRQALMKKTT